MNAARLEKIMDTLEVNRDQLAVLLGKNRKSIDNLLDGTHQINRTYELALEALIWRKKHGNLWAGLSSAPAK